MEQLLNQIRPDQIVMETSSITGWVNDFCQTTGCGFCSNLMRNFEWWGQIESSMSWEEVFLIVSLPFLQSFSFSKHDNFGALSLRPQRMRIARPLTLTEMPEIDHRVRQGFQGVVQFANPLEAHQQTPKLIFPSEASFDSLKPFLKNCWVENGFASTLWCISTTRICGNIRNHAAIENGFAVGATIVDPIQADEGLTQIESDLLGDAGHLRQCCL